MTEALPKPASEISFIPFCDGGALFYPGIQRLWSLNHLASYIWMHLKNNLSRSELVHNISHNFSISPEIAERDLIQLLEHFQYEGLIDTPDSSGPSQPDIEKELDFLLPNGQQLESVDYSRTNESLICLIESNGFTCQIHFPDKNIKDEFEQVYHYFIVTDGIEIAQTIVIQSSVSNNGSYDVYLNKLCVLTNILANRIISSIHFIFFSNCARHLSRNGKLMFHSAALKKENINIMLPANSSSGKSTLTAALSSRDWQCFSDELSVLDLEDLTISALPIPMRIRRGSFAPLLPYYPNLDKLKSFQDLNENEIKWIILPEENLVSAESVNNKITILIFPQYKEKEKTDLHLLDKSIALQKLSITGSSERDMRLDDAKAMVRLVEQTPCYELIFSELQEAITAIESISTDSGDRHSRAGRNPSSL